MLFNFVLYLAFFTFFDSSVTDESFVDEIGVWRILNLVLVSMMSLFIPAEEIPQNLLAYMELLFLLKVRL